ncbi:WhiB family transcriptional regulator [Kitasatospora sp. NPDC085879]|uniref:WhiB family transcriptional regulator n=1 Tax=Kitasatospora sp. NPDC085879 TaxID=3154769 RepID=UPI0034209ABE
METEEHRTRRYTGGWAWQRRAACRGKDAALFFHPAGERGERSQEREAAAKRVCTRCPVRGQCLEYALAADERYGIWGGLTEDERRALRAGARRRGRPAAARPPGRD